MKTKNNTKLPVLKLSEGTLQGGFKSLNDLQKRKIRGGGNNCTHNNFSICSSVALKE